MHRSARLTEKQDAKLMNEVREEPKTKKSRSANKISNIATMDNGTMVEAFKYLNYCQLSKNSLVSKRFVDVIRTHRHKLALLCVDSIRMERSLNLPAVIKIFNKELSSAEYNEWVVSNNYSKQIRLTRQAAVDPSDYELSVYGDYKGTNQERTSVFFAHVKKLNHNNLYVFQHFIRLLTDPFVFIRNVKLIPQTDVFNLLAATIDSNRGRLQCEELKFDLNANSLKSFKWIKDHVRCVKFLLLGPTNGENIDKPLLDFFATGSDCASEMVVIYSHLSKVVVGGLVQKFMNLKNSDESQIIELIRGNVSNANAEALKSKYAKFFVNEETDRFGNTTGHVFEFFNNDIGKKLQLTVEILWTTHQVILQIINL